MLHHHPPHACNAQLLKDVIQLPRPRHGEHGVVRLERHYETEYGIPSTHAMNALAMPWFIVCLCIGRYQGPWLALLVVAAAWTLSCTLSRLYMGVHSPADIWCGFVLGAAVAGAHVVWGEAIDAWVLTGESATYMIPFLGALASLVYPRPTKPRWVSTPGDTILIVGVGVGVSLAARAIAYAHIPVAARSFTGPATLEDLARGLLRVALGFSVLAAVRAVVKLIMQTVMLYIVGEAFDASGTKYGEGRNADDTDPEPVAATPVVSSADAATPDASNGLTRRKHVALAYDDGGLRPTVDVASALQSAAARPANQPAQGGKMSWSPASSPAPVRVPPGRRYVIELPTKFVTYCGVGLATVGLVPWLFQQLQWRHYGI